MGKRNTSRRLAMQALYQADLAKIDTKTALENITEADKYIPETLEFAASLANAAWAGKEGLDQVISQFSIDWSLDRIGKVDRSILRLAIQEIKMGDTPASVIINEAVELAKKYSGQEAAKFINGILGSYVRNEAKGKG
ncbi:transcription antitermination factor NusB [candidate division WOR-1 bacterium RIFOXYB2_FULL_42_35]|uniref:Transcription antitermination protein NusB n=1 Tax=candidate division WOR-1 bacterium RIFOXYC2_FULL_41_25 TaxID=1802586 RepID=A0A1F4TNU0_UNCSA|nr:MAG: transcription antitermination factor NusB [candidate division WOR-1 bacterium RIFOXYA2_FULL_41_14]OGC24777.1 MAG: transcription antitermination factor NusB [candidate division WOR-1 bacterium RIFOXYB2_FULL_42_35]OGC34336.1 MAG: transcription antitermination factor NusB [candidate division WOR-1 bacterium RIFOXYC2_FULL_41_25]OGC43321.1 MAG: transcription antitermination factor NusB [candidate division WOR-1 bacterium RIFOXYD2_FULL_41_8]